ncbi:hypothetical protein FISHEDRAFT_76688 [Fistulina hepatica ATCC 64428]|uniref:HNH nuclease domain-containing protein n=1 Tax=Fistulina hepatica ATCC 64428 TaxID=1128425 RepID=A0A0D7A3Y6_9AGAR|nr:hypothetical protein FISHEDRAFT_76688 [Fistulina hepatica ATCC 64428]
MSEGFFSTSDNRDDNNAVIPTDSVYLKAGDYFFHISDGANADYAICHDFRAWIPPKSMDHLPEPWRSLRRADPGNEDSSELGWTVLSSWITGTIDKKKLQPNYSIPVNVDNINDIRNLITLEQGLHAQTDRHFYTFFPISSSIVSAYFAERRPTSAAAMYHLVQIDLPSRIDPYLLYCRFAWNTIGQVLHSKVRAYDIPLALRSKGRKRQRISESEAGVSGSPTTGNLAGAGDGSSADHSDLHGQDGKEEDREAMDWETYEKKYLGPRMAPLNEIAKIEATIRPDIRQEFDQEASDVEIVSSSFFTEFYYAYPGMTETARLKLKYIKEHQSVTEIGEETTARQDDNLRKGLLLLN